jgi:hypothetical protein
MNKEHEMYDRWPINKVNLYGDVTIDNNTDGMQMQDTEFNNIGTDESYNHMETNYDDYYMDDNNHEIVQDMNHDDPNHCNETPILHASTSSSSSTSLIEHQQPNIPILLTAYLPHTITSLKTSNSYHDMYAMINPSKPLLPLTQIQKQIKNMLRTTPMTTFLR